MNDTLHKQVDKNATFNGKFWIPDFVGNWMRAFVEISAGLEISRQADELTKVLMERVRGTDIE